MDYAEFSYASPDHPPLTRWTIRAIEGLSGRRKQVGLYDVWKETMVGTPDFIWNDLLALINLNVSVSGGEWPPRNLPEGSLVLIANHPYGIGDGLAIPALAENLNRPFRILINNELPQVPEVRLFSLPIYFDGRNVRLFHLVSRYSLTLCLSLLVREFRRILGSVITVRAGDPVPFETLSGLRDRKEIMGSLQARVMEMARSGRRHGSFGRPV